MKLLIGARERQNGWTTYDIEPGLEVDVVGDCRDLGQFADNSIEAIYASHVLEHIPFADLRRTVADWYRVLQPGGTVMIAVPDMNILSQLFIKDSIRGADKLIVMRMMFGGQVDPHDFHHIGFDAEIMQFCLHATGFRDIERVQSFGLFDDSSALEFYGVRISLNVTAKKPA